MKSLLRFVASILVAVGGADRPLAGQEPDVAIDTLFRIDGHEHVLEPLGFAVAGPHDEIAVAQPMSLAVRVFSASGEELAALGRPGQGPGEFEVLTSGGWKLDSLWAFDGRQNRITLLRPGEAGLNTYPGSDGARPAQGSHGLPSAARVLPLAVYGDGAILGRLIAPIVPGDRSSDGEGFIGLVRTGGTLERVVARFERPEGFYYVAGDGSVHGGGYPYQHEPLFGTAPDGSASVLVLTRMVPGSHEGDLVVTRFDAKGDTIFTREIDFVGQPIPRNVREEALSERAAVFPTTEVRNAYRENDRIPAVYPPVTGVVVGSLGSTWLKIRGSGDGSRFMRLDSRGETTGILRLPSSSRLLAARGDRIWAAHKDAFDVESILGLRVRR